MNIKNKLWRTAGIAAAAVGIGMTMAGVASASTGTSMVASVTGASAADPPPASISARIHAAAAGNYHELVNLAYNQCVDAPHGALNVVLQIAPCNGSDTQKWASVAGPSSTTYLVNKSSGYCAEVNNGTSNPGERVDEWYCNGSQAEQWTPRGATAGFAYQQFEHGTTGLSLDTVGGPGSQLMQWYRDANNASQTWLVR
jgi:hypothetical protein